MKLLLNHLGYGIADSKEAVYQGQPGDEAEAFSVLNQAGDVVLTGTAREWGPVARWETGHCWTLDFSALREPGEYTLSLRTARGTVQSQPFAVSETLLTMRLLSAIAYYFKAQRSSGEWLRADFALPFQGERPGTVDGHGGWYDATGDYGMHMSHLSHSTYFSPQQTPLSAWAFFRLARAVESSGEAQYSQLYKRVRDEAVYGADFLMRMRAPSGTFFRTVERFDSFADAAGTRAVGLEYRGSSDQFSEVAATAASETITDENYEVGLRSGGGLCIAALAEAGQVDYPVGDYTRPQYLEAAECAWAYLAANNERYTNDGSWNLIDEYCALTALTALCRATGKVEYHQQAAEMARRIQARMVPVSGDAAYLEVAPGIPYHHPSDEGLPVLALLEYSALEEDPIAARAAVDACQRLMRGLLTVTAERPNPFSYPRFRHREGGAVKTAFFFPHSTTAAPWWQGENARIASLSAAARAVARRTEDAALAAALTAFADRQIDWILGRNPFDASMMEGFGRNHIQYFFGGRYDFLNCPGGVVNGVTSGLEDPEGIAFVTAPTPAVDDNWRWAEQWLPHATWLACSIGLKL